MKEHGLARKETLVIRPDSGDPVKTLLKVFHLLFNKFQFTVNSKSFKVLPPQVRVIQGGWYRSAIHLTDLQGSESPRHFNRKPVMGHRRRTKNIYANNHQHLLQAVFDNGVIPKDHTFEYIRERIKTKTLQTA